LEVKVYSFWPIAALLFVAIPEEKSGYFHFNQAYLTNACLQHLA